MAHSNKLPQHSSINISTFMQPAGAWCLDLLLWAQLSRPKWIGLPAEQKWDPQRPGEDVADCNSACFVAMAPDLELELLDLTFFGGNPCAFLRAENEGDEHAGLMACKIFNPRKNCRKLKWDAFLRATSSMLKLSIFENPGMQRIIPLYQEGAAAELSSLNRLHAEKCSRVGQV